MTVAPDRIRMTEEEYLAWDASHEGRHEYVNGEVLAMAGASEAHELLVANLLAALVRRLAGGPCRAYASNFRVRLDETGMYAYPDLTVVCGKTETAPTRPRTLLNPRVVVEILSQSTEAYDRGAKAAHYRRRASVDALLLVSSTERRIEIQERSADGAWTLADAVGEGAVAIGTLGLTLPVDEVYAGWEPEMAEGE